jgi:hypothetical protein
MRRRSPETPGVLADASLRLRRIGGALKVIGMHRAAGDVIEVASALDRLAHEQPPVELADAGTPAPDA